MVNIIDLTDSMESQAAAPANAKAGDRFAAPLNPFDNNGLSVIYNRIKQQKTADDHREAITKQQQLFEAQNPIQPPPTQSNSIIPDATIQPQAKVKSEAKTSEHHQAQPKQMGRDSSLLYVLDNRIIMEQVGYRDKTNPHIWMHPRDIASSDRNNSLREKLYPLVSMPFPSYHEGEVRKPFVDALTAILQKDPTLSDVPPAQNNTIKSSPFNSPLSYIVNGQNAAKPLSDAEKQQLLEANAIYMMLEYKFSSKHKVTEDAGGYPDLMQDTAKRLARRGVSEPSIDQLMHELKDALGISTTQFVRTASEHGMSGIAELLKIEKPLFHEITNLLSSIKENNFPLNDVVNWEYGRTISPPNSDIAQIIEAGKMARIDDMVMLYSDKIKQYGVIPDQPSNEMLVANALDLTPSLLRESFFQAGGHIIVTQEPDLYNIINQPATGYNLSYNDTENPDKAFNQIFISGDLGLERTNRTIVHEMHHMLFPAHIPPEAAVQADILLSRDEVRLHIFKDLADDYSKALVAGDIQKQNQVMQIFNSPEYAVAGKTMGEMISDVPIPTFLSAINEAYQYLQIESPAYNRIGAYQDPIDRWREIIPRYAEIRFVQNIDRPDLLKFIAPNLTEMYDNIYMPHLQNRLDFVQTLQPNKADIVLNQNVAKLANDFSVNNSEHGNKAWEEKLFNGDVIIGHPAGDNNSVSLAGFGTAHPSVQNYAVKQNLRQDAEMEKPLMQIHSETATVYGLDIDKPTVLIR
jgi:hypothetical protein